MTSTFYNHYTRNDLLSQRLEKYNFSLLTFQLFCAKGNQYIQNDLLSHYKLIILKQGHCKIIHNNKEYLLSLPGSMLLIAPHTIYHAYNLSEQPLYVFSFHFSVSPKVKTLDFNELLPSSIVIGESILSSSLLAMLEETEVKVQNKIPGSYFLCSSTLEFLIGLMIPFLNIKNERLISSPTFHVTRNKLILTCLSYLDKHLYQSISVSELCKLTNVSQSYLYQVFSETFGCSTKEYLMKYKLKKIEKELLQGNASIESIALQYGFSSPYSFSACFKKHYKVSPTAYRRLNQ